MLCLGHKVTDIAFAVALYPVPDRDGFQLNFHMADCSLNKAHDNRELNMANKAEKLCTIWIVTINVKPHSWLVMQ